MSSAKQSLYMYFPKKRYVPATFFLSFSLLIGGLFLPVLYTKQLVFWQNNFSIVSGIKNLYQNNFYGLTVIIFVFSIIFPLLKLSALTYVWFARMTSEQRLKALYWIDLLGKWSMLDVFVIAVTIVIIKAAGPFLNAEPRYGIYVFGVSIALAMLITTHVQKLAKLAR